MSLEQVVDKLAEDRSVVGVWKTPISSVHWTWSPRPGQALDRDCSILVRDGTVTTISLTMLGRLTVADLVARFGVPPVITHGTAGLPEHPYYHLLMSYPTRGLEFEVRLEPYNRPSLESSSQVIGAAYFIPYTSLQDFVRDTHPLVKRDPWPGYGPLPRRGLPGM